MVLREDILSMEYLKKSEFTGCHKGMRYRLWQDVNEEEKVLRVCVWPEPLNFFTTPMEKKDFHDFPFSEEGVVDAVAWMNDTYLDRKTEFENASIS